MKTQKLCNIYFSLILLLTTGCGGIQEISQVSTATNDIFAETAIPKSSDTPTAAILPTVTPTTSPIPTTISTLPPDDAQLRLVDLLSNNGNCRLPCLWGITPGITNYQEAKEIIFPLSGISDFVGFNPTLGDMTPYFFSGDIKVYINIGFLTTNNQVTDVYFEGRAFKEINNGQDRGVEDIFDSETFGEYLRLFLLPQILNEYGVPESVYVFTYPEVPPSRYGKDTFRLILLYPEQGIAIRYTTELQIDQGNILRCLSNAHVKIELHESGNSDKFFELLSASWKEEIRYFYSIEKASSMTVNEFYEAFRQSKDQCVVTPAEIWPPVEK